MIKIKPIDTKPIIEGFAALTELAKEVSKAGKEVEAACQKISKSLNKKYGRCT